MSNQRYAVIFLNVFGGEFWKEKGSVGRGKSCHRVPNYTSGIILYTNCRHIFHLNKQKSASATKALERSSLTKSYKAANNWCTLTNWKIQLVISPSGYHSCSCTDLCFIKITSPIYYFCGCHILCRDKQVSERVRTSDNE